MTTMHTLAEIAAKFARIDGVEDENHASFEKSLRNLVQRHFLPMSAQQGRIFLYDNAAAVTIRLAQIASEFGLPRAALENLSRWLSNSGEREVNASGSLWRVLPNAEEAIQRLEAGESFAVHIIMRADRSVVVKADWKSDRDAELEKADEDERAKAAKSRAKVENTLRSIGYGTQPEIARFSLPASMLIAEILPLLGKD